MRSQHVGPAGLQITGAGVEGVAGRDPLAAPGADPSQQGSAQRLRERRRVQRRLVIAAVPVGQVVGDGRKRLLHYVQREAILPFGETTHLVIGHRVLHLPAAALIFRKSW